MDMQGHIVRIGDSAAKYLVLECVRTLDGAAARLLPVSPKETRPAKPVLLSSLTEDSLGLQEPWHSMCRIAMRDLERPWDSAPMTAFSAQAEFMPFQFRPLLKFFESAGKRLLIADETGLGKTIEAGYIIAEAIAREGATRILILCPSRLRSKWRFELWRRFGLPFRIVNGRGLMQAIECQDGPMFLVASMDCARQTDFATFESLPSQPVFDLLIIDEVHRMIGRTQDTIRRRLGLNLARLSDGVVCLTATPVQLDFEDLERILDIAAPGIFDTITFGRELEVTGAVNRICKILASRNWGSLEMKNLDSAIEELEILTKNLPDWECTKLKPLMSSAISAANLGDSAQRWFLRKEATSATLLSNHLNRTRSVEVGENRDRVIETARVRLNEEPRRAMQQGKSISVSEAELFKSIDAFLQKSFFHVHRMQLSSSLPAMIDLLRLGMRGYDSWEAWNREDDSHDEVPFETPLNESQRQTCKLLVDLYGLLPADSKWEAFLLRLNELKEKHHARKVIVFTHWRPTFQYFVKQSSSLRDFRCVMVSPDSDDDRMEAEILRFNQMDGFAVLFTTDILREGFDLDAADCVINYDLSYNPQVIEQRIGRIDRIGQVSNRILVFNFVVEGSLDEVIYDRILSRIGVFEKTIGDMKPITEELAKSLQETGVIDDEVVIKAMTLEQDRRKLMEHEAFLSIEDVFDEEIKSAHAAGAHAINRLHWIVLARFFETISPSAHVEWNSRTRDLVVRGFSYDASEAIETLVDLDVREMVRWYLRAHTSDEGVLTIHMHGGRDSLPNTHPLMRAAIMVVSRAYLTDVQESGNVPCVLRTKVKLPGVTDAVRYLALVEYLFNGSQLRRREWTWLGLTETGEVLPLKDVDAAALFEICTGLSEDANEKTPFEIAKTKMLKYDESHFEQWVSDLVKGEVGLRTVALTMRLRSANSRLDGLITENEVDGHHLKEGKSAPIEALQRDIAGMHQSLEQLKNENFTRDLVRLSCKNLLLIVAMEGTMAWKTNGSLA